MTDPNPIEVPAEAQATLAVPDDLAFTKERRGKLGVFFWICVGWLGITIASSMFAPLLHLQNPNAAPFVNENASPSLSHWFGTDQQGQDLFSRTVFGGRVSIEVGFGAIIFANIIGGTLGMLAAYRRGKLDLILSSVMYTILAFPATIFVLGLLSFWQPRNIYKIILIIGIAAVPLVYRVIRAATLSVATRDYVLAAKVQGATTRRIVMRELLPNIAPTAMSFFLIGIATVVLLEGGLSFLGVSVDPSQTPTWGNMVALGHNYLQSNPWMTLFPSLAICLFLLSLNFAGDRLRAYFDVTEVKL